MRKGMIELPEYPGGKSAFNKFIDDHLRYPEEALENRIEGTVHLSYHVDHNGNVSEVKVKKGLGYGCDEEAVRLVSSLKYGRSKNRGLKVGRNVKIRIPFRLPPDTRPSFRYVVKTDKEAAPRYGYTINIAPETKR